VTSEWLEQIKKRALEEGVIWLTGEMEFPTDQMIHQTLRRISLIAEQWGYMASKQGMSRIVISGAGLPGQVVLDWFHSDRPGPQRIELWTCSHILLT
jgi:hypothetical protein